MLIKRICSQNFWKTGERGRTEGRRFLLAARELLLKEDGMRSIIQYGIACYKKDCEVKVCQKNKKSSVSVCCSSCEEDCNLTFLVRLVGSYGLKLKKALTNIRIYVILFRQQQTQLWRNWHTRQTKDLVWVNWVRVQVPSTAQKRFPYGSRFFLLYFIFLLEDLRCKF